ncbi:alpha/beta fold hydrolase [Streptomyces harbinensis]|uniref:alpha/beta fold hydrolase n=1 Tax=Streptomyces harbinensis TaxID=1176198 RepID=UPI0034DFEA23
MHPAVAALGTALNTTAGIAPSLAGRAAFALFRRPVRRARIGETDRSPIAAAERGALTIGGKNVVTYRWGTGGRPVLLVHGWSSRASRLAHLATALHARGHTVLTFDLPGHGASGGTTTTVLECRDVILELQRRHGPFLLLAGYSFGSLASFLAAREGARTEALAGIAGVSRFDHLVTGFCRELRLSGWAEPELRTRVERRLFPGEPDIWRRFSATHAPERIAVGQILLVHDEDDPRAGAEQARETARAHGERAELFLTRGLGHHRVITAPAVTARVADFADAVRDRAATP